MAGETIERGEGVEYILQERMDRLASYGHMIHWSWGSWKGKPPHPECSCGWCGWDAGAKFVPAISAHFDEVERTLLNTAIAEGVPLDDAEQAFLEANYPA